MIQLYKPDNTNFDYNGDYILTPVTCDAYMELNGLWYLEMTHSVDNCIDCIVENAVISVDTPIGDRQLYRIIQKEKSDDIVYAYALPIFCDCVYDCFMFDVRPTEKTGQQALDIMTANSKYKGHSDITTLNTAYYIQKNLGEAISSDDENAFLNRWGGEILYNNYDIHINHRIGQNRGMRAEFGFNLTEIKESVNMENVVTRIVPKAYNGHILPSEETVDSPNIGKYPIVYMRVIEYPNIKLQIDCNNDEQGYDDLPSLYEALRKAAQKEFDDNHIDIPTISYEVSLVDLSQTDHYKEYEKLMLISLGDTVLCKNRKLDIETDARVIKVHYDCITKSISTLTLGDYDRTYLEAQSNVFNSVSRVLDLKNHTVMADKVYGIINATNAQLRYQKDIAKKQDVRAILFEDLDPQSPTYGATCLGSLGFQIANKRTADGTDWDWSTAANANGIVADTITAGILQGIELIGNTIKGGKIIGDTTIKVGTDLYVGDNIYLGEDGSGYKKISFNNKSNIEFYKGSVMIRHGMNFDIGGSFRVSETALSAKLITNSGKELLVHLSENGISFTIETVSIAIFTKDNTFIKNNLYAMAKIIASEHAMFYKDVSILGNLSVSGSKNRVVSTQNYGKIKMNAVESADCLFTDQGQILLDDDGYATIFFDSVWLETVNTEETYHIQLTPYCEMTPWIVREYSDRCIIAGKANTKVNWQISALQRGYEKVRLEKVIEGVD